jgi:tRNA(fMet)-specific endonuclease VapC
VSDPPFLPIIAFDEQAARWRAEERARLRKSGRTPSYADSQIAAIAVVNELGLVTRNTGDFADFHGVQTANWFEQNEAYESAHELAQASLAAGGGVS